MISVIVPIYNSETLIKNCLESILNQTYTNLEILLIDDGSTDSSGLICESYSKIDKRIKVFHKTNEGVSSARNYGLTKAKGDYIAFLDNDDYIHPLYFEFLLKAIENSNAEMAMIYYEKTFIVKKLLDRPKFKFFHLNPKYCLTKLFESDNPNIHIPYVFVWAKLYKRELLKDMSFKDIYGEDIDFSYNIYIKLKKTVVIPHIMYYWLQHSSSQHRNRKAFELYKYIECYVDILKYIPANNKELKGKCLKKLYITILSVRYNVKYYLLNKKSINSLNSKLKETALKYYKEFLLNKYVPLYFKISIILFYFSPITYNLFRWWKEITNKYL